MRHTHKNNDFIGLRYENRDSVDRKEGSRGAARLASFSSANQFGGRPVVTPVSVAIQVQLSSRTLESNASSPVFHTMNCSVIVSPGVTGACVVSQPVAPPTESFCPHELSPLM